MGCIGCKFGKPKSYPKSYEILIEEDSDVYQGFINIYQSGDPEEYKFYGILPPDVKKFYLVFKKQDEERLPLAISFEIRDDTFLSNQYQFMRQCIDKNAKELDCLVIQFPDSELTNVYCCNVSPSFPFPVEVSGEIKLKIA